MRRITEIVTTDEIKRWKENDIITISAGTGAGKSYLIKNILYAIAKYEGVKILMLIHRSNCVKQFQKEIERDNKTDVIDICTYQKIEWKNKKEIKDKLYQYKYIVCDEFHYFVNDANFNKMTDISLKTILQSENNIKIFMSATGDAVSKYLKEYRKLNTIDYKMKRKFDFIEKITLYNEEVVMEDFAQNVIDENKKAILFIKSANKAYELFKQFSENAIFNCSKSNGDFYKYVDKEEIDSILENERFEKNLLITTTCMDAGVNIIDDDLEYILCDIDDIDVIVQCIGRKRLQNSDDIIQVFLRDLNNCRAGGLKGQAVKKLEKADYLRKHGEIEYVEEYGRDFDSSCIVYDAVVGEYFRDTMKSINDLAYFKATQDIETYDEILTKKYKKFLSERLGIPQKKIERLNYEEQIRKDKTYKYLISLIGKKLYKEERNELIEILDVRGSNRMIQKGIAVLSAYTRENYEIDIISKTDNNRRSEDGNKNVNYKKVYWYITDISLQEKCE